MVVNYIRNFLYVNSSSSGMLILTNCYLYRDVDVPFTGMESMIGSYCAVNSLNELGAVRCLIAKFLAGCLPLWSLDDAAFCMQYVSRHTYY
jgi:hypothetical protein